jgi:hypothetical protein
MEETLVPHVERPDENKGSDEIRPEDSAHDGDYLNMVYDVTVSGSGPCFRTGPGGLEDVESSGSLAGAHLESFQWLVFRGQNFFYDDC